MSTTTEFPRHCPIVFVFSFLLAGHGAFAQAPSLSLASGSALKGTSVSLNLSLTATASGPAALQWTLSYPVTAISSVAISAGSALTSAGDTLTCAPGSGTLTCVASGTTATAVGSGVVAVVTANLSGSSSSTLDSLTLSNIFGALPSGMNADMTGTGGTITVLPTVSSLQCNPTSVGSGTSTTCTVTLSLAAPSGGTVVSLSSNNSALAVPSSVTVAAGATTVTFTATAGTISSSQSATVTASYSGTSATTSVSLAPATSVSSLSCSPNNLSSNSSSTCTVTLSQPAPTGGASVTLSDNSSALTTPASVSVPASATTATFTVTTGALTSNSSATITATYNGSSANATVTLTASILVSSLSCIPTSLLSLASTTCTVTLNQPAPTGGANVTLSNSNSILTIPTAITVPAGTTSATFSGAAAIITSLSNATITATYNGSSATFTISLLGSAVLTGLTCSPTTLAAGASSTCAVTLNQAAPTGGFSVSLTNSNTLALSLPASVSVPSTATTATFSATAADVATAQSATVTATSGSNSFTATIGVQAAPSPISFVQVNAQEASSAVKTLSITFPANTKAGDLILVGFDFASNAAFSSITDSQKNAFTEVGQQLRSSGATYSRVYYANAIKGGAETVTVNLSAKTNHLKVLVTEYAGVANTGPIDAQSGASGGAGPVSSGLATTTAADDLIYGYCATAGGCSAGTGFTARINRDDDLIEDKPTSNPGSYAATGTSNAAWTMQMVALKPAVNVVTTAQVVKAPAKTGTSRNSASDPVFPRATAAAPLSQNAPVSLTCMPRQIDAGGMAKCALQVAASSTPYPIALSSSSQQLQVPAAVMTRANQTSLTFQVQAAPAAQQQLVTVNASAGAIAVQDTVQVAAASHPIVTAPDHVSARLGAATHFKVSAVDPSALPTELTASKLPAGANFDTASGDFTWTAGQYSKSAVTFTATNSAAQSSSRTVIIDVTSGTPTLTALDRNCSPGALGSVNGSSLSGSDSAPSDPSGNSMELGGTKIKINGQYVSVTSASSTEVQFVCPSLPPGTPLAVTAVTESGSSEPLSSVMQSVAPWIFLAEPINQTQGAVSFAGTTDLAMARNTQIPAHPAQPGDDIVILATGLGLASDASSWMVSANVGGVDAVVNRVEALADRAGVYAVQVRVPVPLEFGDQVPIQLQVMGPDGKRLQSNRASIALEPAAQ